MKVAYYPSGGRDMASSRLRVWKIADVLQAMGHTVVFNELPPNSDVLIVQKRVDDAARDAMVQAHQWDIRCFYDIDDFFDHPVIRYAQQVIVDTPYKLQLHKNAQIVPDCLDTEPNSPCKTGQNAELKRVVTVCNADNAFHTANVAQACYQLGLEFRIITDLGRVSLGEIPGAQGVQWTVENVDRELVECDLLVCPYLPENGTWSREWVLSKSANRLLKGWALGLPVAGTPIPSYTEAGLVYQATSVGEWVAVLQTLDAPMLRRRDAYEGSERAAAFRADKVVHQWLRVFAG